MKKRIYLAIVLVTILFSVSCTKNNNQEDLWDSAVYTADTQLGEGDKQITLEVIAADKSVTFTINTNEDILGPALLEHSLIEGDDGPYGLYVKKVNGITADYDTDNTYWSLSKNLEALMTGVDSTEISDGEKYEFTRTK